eukprot:g35887.t1
MQGDRDGIGVGSGWDALQMVSVDLIGQMACFQAIGLWAPEAEYEVLLLQVLHKTVSEPQLGLTNVKEATTGAAHVVDHVEECPGEPLRSVRGKRQHLLVAEI